MKYKSKSIRILNKYKKNACCVLVEPVQSRNPSFQPLSYLQELRIVTKKNNIALAVKDKSIAKVLHTNFENNEIQLSAYSKNWQYGGGGSAFIYRSYFKGKNNFLNSSEKTNLLIDDTSIVGEINIIGKNISINNVDFYDTKKIINTDDLKLTHPMFSKISLGENINRGYNPLIKEITN